ncbi:MAG: TatD family hydrolase [Vampirovibrionales bacterium]
MSSLPPNNTPTSSLVLVDTHSHVDYIMRREGPKPFSDDVEETEPHRVLARAQAMGVAAVINPGTEPQHFSSVLQLAVNHPALFAALSVHPCDVSEQPSGQAHRQSVLNDIEQALNDPVTGPRIVAIGETGLDYYHPGHQSPQAQKQQQEWFLDLMALACRHQLPVIVHDREAHQDVARCVAQCPGVTGVMHCFSGDAAFADTMMGHGFYISFAGNVTFKNATALHEAARAVPLDRLLIETDAPFLAPIPHRGKASEPAYVFHVAEKIAELKGVSLETVAQASTQNALALFSKLTLPQGVTPQC